MSTEKKFMGHPRGLATLFFTEFWERFSFYGFRALLVLYCTASPELGGLGYDIVTATSIYGSYLMYVYILSLPGGWIADRYLGQRKAVFYGGSIIALGHITLAFSTEFFFYSGLVFIVLGTGLLKPNVSAMVGGLYRKGDPRRDGGFTIFYMGINLGAFLAPLITGYVAQNAGFLEWLNETINVSSGWHVAFSIAAVGMIAGLYQFKAGYKYLGNVGLEPSQKAKDDKHKKMEPFTSQDKKQLAAIGILFLFCIFFWSAFEQAGSSLNLFANDLTNNVVFCWEFPSTWFQSLNALFIIMFAPLFSKMWLNMANSGKEPSGATKFSFGLIGVGLGFGVLYVAVIMFPGQLVGPLWLTSVYLLHTWGELALSPVGLSLMTKLAPKQIGSFVMGIWFTATGLGNKFGGWVAGFYDASSSDGLSTLFGGVTLYCIVAGVILLFLVKPISKLSGDSVKNIPDSEVEPS